MRTTSERRIRARMRREAEAMTRAEARLWFASHRTGVLLAGLLTAIVAGSLIWTALFNMPADLDARVVDWGVTDAGRIRVTILVGNTTDETVTPECEIRVLDSDGSVLATDLLDAARPLAAGESARYGTVTGLRVGAHAPAGITSECAG